MKNVKKRRISPVGRESKRERRRGGVVQLATVEIYSRLLASEIDSPSKLIRNGVSIFSLLPSFRRESQSERHPFYHRRDLLPRCFLFNQRISSRISYSLSRRYLQITFKRTLKKLDYLTCSICPSHFPISFGRTNKGTSFLQLFLK